MTIVETEEDTTMALAQDQGVDDDAVAALCVAKLADRRVLMKWNGSCLDADRIDKRTLSNLIMELTKANPAVVDTDALQISLALFLDVVREQVPALRKRAAGATLAAPLAVEDGVIKGT